MTHCTFLSWSLCTYTAWLLLFLPPSFLLLTSPAPRPRVASKLQELHWSVRDVISILHRHIAEWIGFWWRDFFGDGFLSLGFSLTFAFALPLLSTAAFLFTTSSFFCFFDRLYVDIEYSRVN